MTLSNDFTSWAIRDCHLVISELKGNSLIEQHVRKALFASRGNVWAYRCVGVSAFAKHHQLRRDLLIIIAVPKSSLTSPDADTPIRRYANTPIRFLSRPPKRAMPTIHHSLSPLPCLLLAFLLPHSPIERAANRFCQSLLPI